MQLLEQRARELRNNPTDAERALWRRLSRRQLEGCRFRRQKTIGPYIVDFVCFEKRLVVELDGGQHADSQEYDAQRTAWLESRGFRVLRFWNHQVLSEGESVVQAIWSAVAEESPHPDPPPRFAEGGNSSFR